MNDARDIFLRRVYDRSFHDLKTLSAKLPEDTVITLAREVLLHVAGKADPDLPAPADIETLALDLIHHDPDRAAGVVRSIQISICTTWPPPHANWAHGGKRTVFRWWM